METLDDRGTGMKWHWDNIRNDLKNQGVTVFINDMGLSTCQGTHGDLRFLLTWAPDQLALLTTTERDDELVRALSAIFERDAKHVGDNPDNLPHSFEWDLSGRVLPNG